MRALVIALLGGWIAGTLILAGVATQNFRTIDRLLSAPTPEFSHAIAPLEHDAARVVLRHLASELNRLYFGSWVSSSLPSARRSWPQPSGTGPWTGLALSEQR